MSEYRKQLRKDLGYKDSDQDSTVCQSDKAIIPGRYFAYSAIAVFVGGVIGMVTEMEGDNINHLLLYFSMSFLIAPALLVFPVIRMLVGEEKTDLAAFLSVLFGYYIQSSIKKKMK